MSNSWDRDRPSDNNNEYKRNKPNNYINDNYNNGNNANNYNFNSSNNSNYNNSNYKQLNSTDNELLLPFKFINDHHHTDSLRRAVLSIVFPENRNVSEFMLKKAPGPLPISLSRKYLNIIKLNKYAVLEKSDGERIMFYIANNEAYLINRKFEFYYIENSVYPSLYGKGYGTLLDGELILNNGSSMYLVYDIVQLNGDYVGHRFLKERLEKMTEVIGIFKNTQIQGFKPFDMKRKSFMPKNKIHFHFNNISRLVDGSYQNAEASRGLINLNDGLIFTPEDEPYIPSDNAPLLKWKWPDLNSIDFKVKFPYFVNKKGISKLELYCGSQCSNSKQQEDLLFREITVDDKSRQWILDSLPKEPYSQCVVECVYDPAISNWSIKKVRTDKNTGNFISTVVSTMETVIDNVTQLELCKTCACVACHPIEK